MLDVGSRVPSRRPGHRSNMQTLAKAQVRKKFLFMLTQHRLFVFMWYNFWLCLFSSIAQIHLVRATTGNFKNFKEIVWLKVSRCACGKNFIHQTGKCNILFWNLQEANLIKLLKLLTLLGLMAFCFLNFL